MSVLDYINFGSTVSVRGFVRMGSSLSVHSIRASLLYADSSNTYIKEGSNTLEVYVKGNRALSLESDGGILHGSWTSNAPLVTSDRRMKKDIVPLQRTLRGAMSNMMASTQLSSSAARSPIVGKDEGASLRGKIEQPQAPQAEGSAGQSDGALWLLRQLRPVSYSFRKGAESKYMRFGFIADELESVVPQVVRNVGGSKEFADQKAVVYQDLIALLAAALQEQQKRTEVLKENFEHTFVDLRAELKALREDDAEKEREIMKKKKTTKKTKRRKAKKKKSAGVAQEKNATAQMV
jgi:hypothetical protein